MTSAKKWSEEAIRRLEIEGRGKGAAEHYLPWIMVHDISSRGRSRRVMGVKVRRPHHLLSDLEWQTFLHLEHCPSVVDIREQFPLDRDITRELAAVLGIHHPCYPGTHVPVVMTTDFLATRIIDGKQVFEAFDVKDDEAAEDDRVLAKLQLHRAYFEGMGMAHRLVFRSSISKNIARNLEWARQALCKPGEEEAYEGLLEEVARRIDSEFGAYSKRSLTLADYCADFDFRHGYGRGTALRAAGQMIYVGRLRANLSNRDLHACPLSSLYLSDPHDIWTGKEAA